MDQERPPSQITDQPMAPRGRDNRTRYIHKRNTMKVKDFYDIGVKSGMFGQKAKFGQRSCLFHTSTIGMKNILTKQTVNILMRRLIRSRLIIIFTVCKGVSEFT